MDPIQTLAGAGMEAEIWKLGIKLFLLVWIIFVPVVITSRLERIIRILEEKD
jgi:hypothetical protein